MENQTKVKSKKNTLFILTVVTLTLSCLMVLGVGLSVLGVLYDNEAGILIAGIVLIAIFALAIIAIEIIKIILNNKGQQLCKYFTGKRSMIINIVNMSLTFIGFLLIIITVIGFMTGGKANALVGVIGAGIELLVALESIVMNSIIVAKHKKEA